MKSVLTSKRMWLLGLSVAAQVLGFVGTLSLPPTVLAGLGVVSAIVAALLTAQDKLKN